MAPDVVLINAPAIDFQTFLGLSQKALGYSPARQADQSGRRMSDAEKFLWCLDSFRDEDQKGIATHLLGHVSFSVFICADERDLIEIYDCASGMHMASAETLITGVKVAVLSGTLAQWRDAIKGGASQRSAPMVRACYSKILLHFDKAGLSSVWSDFDRRPAPDHTGLYLEDKR